MERATIIIKPTNACNADCVYCSADNASEKSFMSNDTVRILFARIKEWLSYTSELKSIKLIWHGGEPTLMPVNFYYRVLELEEEIFTRFGVKIENHIQSNMLFVNEKKIKMLKIFLKRNNRKRSVGTSYDPIPGIRILKNAIYLEEWQKSINLLLLHNIHYGIVYVVHKKSLENVNEIAQDFLKKFPQVSIRFNPLYKEGKAAGKECESLYISPLEWGQFLVSLYRIWESYAKEPSWFPLKEIDDFHFNNKSRLCCDSSGKCGYTHLGINTDGGVYNCGRGIDRKYKSFGNIREHSFLQLLNSPARREIINRTSYIYNTFCHLCRWWFYCHGGCPMDAAISRDNNIFSRSNFCISRQHYFNTIYKEPKTWKRKQ